MLKPAERDQLRVVLVRTRNPLNIGAVARAMSNFGVLKLRLVEPYEKAFREVRSAVGAVELLKRAEVFESVAAAVGDCKLVVGATAVRHREIQHPLKALDRAAVDIRRALHSHPVALMFGSEKYGLSVDDLSHCNLLLRIPTREEHISMNLGHAVAVTLYELNRTKMSPAAKSPKKPAPTADDLERITGVLVRSLLASGYIKKNIEASTEQKIRRLVRRLTLDESDAEVWLAMLRKLLWKIEQG